MGGPGREFAEKGVSVAGDDLLANSDNHAGAQVYTRIMTRLRQQEAAFQRLQTGMTRANQFPPLIQQVAKNALESAANTELRKNLLATRNANARTGMIASRKEMGSAVDRYFIPEEKLSFARATDTKIAAMPPGQAGDFFLPLAD